MTTLPHSRQAAQPRPASGAERVCLGTLLECGNTDLPPTLARLLAHAPESFDDHRHGSIAVTIRTLRDTGKPVHPSAVAEAVAGNGAAVLLAGLADCALSPELAEVEAADVWTAYTRRQARKVLGEALAACDAAPDQTPTIVRNTVATLAGLDGEAAAPLSELLASRAFNVANPPPEPETRFAIGQTPICTPGNLTAITAGIKSGKSSFIGAMLAATMKPDAADVDTLSVSSGNPNGCALLHLDTEQSRADHHALIARAVRRAALIEPPPWFHSFCVTGFTVPELREAIPALFKQLARRHGGIHSAHLDGAADFVADVNDPVECNAFVAQLHALAIEFECPIVGVIHFNPGTEKTRGHLGSQFERKAETNLRLDKDGEAIVVWSEKNRRAPILKATGPRFIWSEEHRMHVSVESVAQAREQARQVELRAAAELTFDRAEKPALRWSEFLENYAQTAKLKPKTARNHFEEMVRAQVVRKNLIGQYELA